MITYPNVKVNLGLGVLRRREDGYHDLETLFVPYFGLHDTLEVVPGDDYSETLAGLIERYGPVPEEVPEGYVPNLAQAISGDGKLMITLAKADGVQWNPLEDLTARAYFLLAKDHKLPPVKIFLEKGSPVGAGLGGGSSDAAFALSMYNDLFCLGLEKKQLARYASLLGSDCAFFVFNTPMMGEGRGEILSPYNLRDIDYGQKGGDALPYELKVIVPEGISVSTAQAYRGITPRDLRKDCPLPISEALSLPMERWKDCLENDFEKTVFSHHPQLEAIKRSLYDSGAIYASMSGSGSALFAIYEK